jgi:2'-5' RNA ligase
MRFFIALEIPQVSQQQIQDVQAQLKNLIPEVRITNSDKLHLTLAFIGEQPDNLRERLTEIISKACLQVPKFEVTPAYLDAFPNIHNPNIFWVGVKGDIDKLLLIRERIKDQLANLNLVIDERRFTPHIAIGKISDFRVRPDVEERLQEMMARDFEPIKISSIKLFESIPDESFHTHNTLAEIQLEVPV